VELHSLFPTVVATDRLVLDPLETAAQLQTLAVLGQAISMGSGKSMNTPICNPWLIK